MTLHLGQLRAARTSLLHPGSAGGSSNSSSDNQRSCNCPSGDIEAPGAGAGGMSAARTKLRWGPWVCRAAGHWGRDQTPCRVSDTFPPRRAGGGARGASPGVWGARRTGAFHLLRGHLVGPKKDSDWSFYLTDAHLTPRKRFATACVLALPLERGLRLWNTRAVVVFS